MKYDSLDLLLSFSVLLPSPYKEIISGPIGTLLKDYDERRYKKIRVRDFVKDLFSEFRRTNESFDEICKLIDSVDKDPNVDELDRKLQLEIRIIIDDEDEQKLKAYSECILCFICKTNRNSSDRINEYLEKRRTERIQKIEDKKRAQAINSFFAAFEEMLDERFQSLANKLFMFHTIPEVADYLRWKSYNVLDLSFFEGIDLPFAEHLKYLIEKSKNEINVYSECREEAVYYVLYILQTLNYERRSKIINTRADWHKVDVNAGDILVADFLDCTSVESRNSCITIKIHDRRKKDVSNFDGNLTLRRRSMSNLSEALLRCFNNDLNKVDRLIENTNGYYSLIESRICESEMDYSWESLFKGDNNLILNDVRNAGMFLVLTSFDRRDEAVLNKIGFKINDIEDTAYKINKLEGIPFSYKSSSHEYSLYSPFKVMNCFLQQGDEFEEMYKELVVRVLNADGISAKLINNVLYTAVYYVDKANSSNRKVEFIFENVKKKLLSRDDYQCITEALTELCPEGMLEWFSENHFAVNDDNAPALALLMHDGNTVMRCIQLLVRCYNPCSDVSFNILSVKSLINEFFRVGGIKYDLSVPQITRTLNEIDNYVAIRDIIFDCLPRRGQMYILLPGSYLHRSKTSTFRHFSDIECHELFQYEIEWFLNICDYEGLVKFIGEIDYFYFNFKEYLIEAWERVSEDMCIDDKEYLYVQLFKSYWNNKNWYFDECAEGIESIKECLNVVKPENSLLRIFPLIEAKHSYWRYSFNERENNRCLYLIDYANEIASFIKNENVEFDDYLSLPSLVDIPIDEWLYIEEFFLLYPEKAKSLTPTDFSKLPQSIVLKYLVKLHESENIFDIIKSCTPEFRLSVAFNMDYFTAAKIIDTLPVNLKNEYWRSVRRVDLKNVNKGECLNFISCCNNCSNQEASLSAIEQEFDLFSPKEVLALLNSSNFESDSPSLSVIAEKVFRKLRVSAFAGDISCQDEMWAELRLLSIPCNVKTDSMLCQRLKGAPDALCEIVKYIDDGKIRGANSIVEKCEEIIWGVYSPYHIAYSELLILDNLGRWIEDFIDTMEQQLQPQYIQGILADVLVGMIDDFDSPMPAQICTLLEKLRYRNYSLAEAMPKAFEHRCGGFFENNSIGVSAEKYREFSAKFRNSFPVASKIYAEVSEKFEKWYKESLELRDRYER